ncbi:Uncharacterised protein [Salmonella enterica subsp. enterica]|uniref:Transposase n=1 Tax=Salmonella enterica I TaxID=59201 RepID=A0A379VL15_SALET|nr:Uncharacterised protein [Salmonella enterica subsp. enterica]
MFTPCLRQAGKTAALYDTVQIHGEKTPLRPALYALRRKLQQSFRELNGAIQRYAHRLQTFVPVMRVLAG